LLAHLAERLGRIADNRVVFHYLDGKVDAEIYGRANRQAGQADACRRDEWCAMMGSSV
jgi:hypothetical protein